MLKKILKVAAVILAAVAAITATVLFGVTVKARKAESYL